MCRQWFPKVNSQFFLELCSYSGAKLGSLKEIWCWGRGETHKSYKTALRTQDLQGDKQWLSFINTCEGPGAPCVGAGPVTTLYRRGGVHRSPLGSNPSDAHSSLPQGKFPSPFWVLGHHGFETEGISPSLGKKQLEFKRMLSPNQERENGDLNQAYPMTGCLSTSVFSPQSLQNWSRVLEVSEVMELLIPNITTNYCLLLIPSMRPPFL